MVSSCKVCGARTAGHRQYCPDCRASGYGPGKSRNRITGLGSMKIEDGKFTRSLSVAVVSVVVFFAILFNTLILTFVFLIEFFVKTLILGVKKIFKNNQKVFTLDSFEKKIFNWIKRMWLNSFDFMKRNAKKEFERPYEKAHKRKPLSRPIPFNYRRKLSDNLRNYCSGL